jgi:hypothetical protein
LRHLIESSKHGLHISAEAIRSSPQFVRIRVCSCNPIPEHSIFLFVSAWPLQQLLAGLYVIEYDGFVPSRVLGDGVRDNELQMQLSITHRFFRMFRLYFSGRIILFGMRRKVYYPIDYAPFTCIDVT